MNTRRLASQAYILLRRIVWASPLARNPFWAEIFIRTGHTLRHWFGLSPQESEILSVHGSKMMFGAASECYVDMINDSYEPEVTRLFDELVKPGMVVVDVGAHIGYYTLLAAKHVGPTGRVYAFEPAPVNYELLMKNIALNEYQNVTAIQKAVCDVQGTASFFMHMDTVGHSLHPTTQDRGKTTITVETTPLDHFFEQEGWPPVNLVKVDVEGAEPAALTGMTKLIERNQSVYLFMEFVPHILRSVGMNPDDLLEQLKGLGFTIQVITGGGLQPLDGNILKHPALRADLFCERSGT